jgi:DNA modification methylase
MRSIVRDYSRPGDLICDPCAGGATTLIAAQLEGRDSIGSEMDPQTHARAMRRIQYGRHAAKADDQPCFDFDRLP